MWQTLTSNGIIATVSVLFFTFVFSLWIWAFIDLLMRRDLSAVQKVVWFLVLLSMNFLGALLYRLLSRPRRAGQGI